MRIGTRPPRAWTALALLALCACRSARPAVNDQPPRDRASELYERYLDRVGDAVRLEDPVGAGAPHALPIDDAELRDALRAMAEAPAAPARQHEWEALLAVNELLAGSGLTTKVRFDPDPSGEVQVLYCPIARRRHVRNAARGVNVLPIGAYYVWCVRVDGVASCPNAVYDVVGEEESVALLVFSPRDPPEDCAVCGVTGCPGDGGDEARG